VLPRPTETAVASLPSLKIKLSLFGRGTSKSGIDAMVVRGHSCMRMASNFLDF
jgi:hypothetical protein